MCAPLNYYVFKDIILLKFLKTARDAYYCSLGGNCIIVINDDCSFALEAIQFIIVY